MNIEITVDTEAVEKWLRAIWASQLPFAISKAINATAIDFQKVQRAHQESIFTIRRKAFVQNAVKIKPFASKTSLAARIWIDPPGGQARADILTKFETDTEKLPFRGVSIAVPTANVPRTGAGIVQKQWRAASLKLLPHGRGSRALPGHGHMVLQGGRGTFAVLKPGGRGTIFLRKGGTVVPLYFLVPNVRIKPNLDFIANGERTVRTRWAHNFEVAFEQAMRTAR